MGDGNVIVVECVVVGDLPVAGQVLLADTELLTSCIPGIAGFGMNELQLVFKRQGLIAECDPDQWAIDAAGKLEHSPSLAIKAFFKLRFTCRCLKFTSEVVSPAVIRTDQTSTGFA